MSRSFTGIGIREQVESGGSLSGGATKFVQRNKLTFEKKNSAALTRQQEEELQRRLHQDGRPNMKQGFFSKLFCPLNRPAGPAEFRPAPDASFCATSLIQLSHGITAYRLIEPCYVADDKAEDLPVCVCLHGMYDSSYIWGDCSDLLCDCERGPNCRVLVFDFYGRGRSPWTGIPCTLDVLVVQTKELLDLLGLADSPVSLIGYDMGGAVAVGFAAKYPDLCLSLCLIAPVGIKYAEIEGESWLKSKYVGEYYMYNRRKKLAPNAESEFFDSSPECPHRALIDRQTEMINWQVNNTNGYLGAVLSTIRLFPLRGMDELFTAVGRFERPVLVLWGERDGVTSYSRSINIMERCFPKGYIVGVSDCGHHPLAEQFTDVMTEILSFHKICHEDANIASRRREKGDKDEETKL